MRAASRRWRAPEATAARRSAAQRSGSAVALTDERAEEHAGHHQRDGLVHVDQHNLNGLREKIDAAQTKVTEMAEGREKESETAAVAQIVAARAIAIGASDVGAWRSVAVNGCPTFSPMARSTPNSHAFSSTLAVNDSQRMKKHMI